MSLAYDTSIILSRQWLECQQYRGHRSTVFSVIGKLWGGWLRMVEGTSSHCQGCLCPRDFRNLNSPSICSFDVDLYLVQKKKEKSCAHCHCVLPIVPLMLLQVWLELLKPITKQVKSKYGRSLKECSPQFTLEKSPSSAMHCLTLLKWGRGT